MVNSAPLLQANVSETCEKTKKVPGKKGQRVAEPEQEREESQVMQIIESIRTIRRTPQEILAAFNNKKSNQTTYRPSREPLLPARKPSPLTADVQPPPTQKSKSPNKTLPTPLATPIEGRLTLQAPEIAVQQPVNPLPLVCPICGEQFNHPHQCSFLASNGPGLVQRVQERSGLLSTPSIVDSYKSEITVQSPGEGSSSSPSAHGQDGDSYGENDAAELLLGLSAKNIAASLVSLSPIQARPSAEIDETSNEGAKVESENSEDDERQVVPSILSQARRKSSESYRSKSSSDPPSAKDMASPDSRPIPLPAPPIVQSASLIRPRPRSTFPQPSPISVAVDPSPELPGAPVIEKHKSLIPHDISMEPGEINQSEDEELEPTQIRHHVCCFWNMWTTLTS